MLSGAIFSVVLGVIKALGKRMLKAAIKDAGDHAREAIEDGIHSRGPAAIDAIFDVWELRTQSLIEKVPLLPEGWKQRLEAEVTEKAKALDLELDARVANEGPQIVDGVLLGYETKLLGFVDSL